MNEPDYSTSQRVRFTVEGDAATALDEHTGDGGRWTRWAYIGPLGAVGLVCTFDRANGWDDLWEAVDIHRVHPQYADDPEMASWEKHGPCNLLPGGVCWSQPGSFLQASEIGQAWEAADRDDAVIYAALRERYGWWLAEDAPVVVSATDGDNHD